MTMLSIPAKDLRSTDLVSYGAGTLDHRYLTISSITRNSTGWVAVKFTNDTEMTLHPTGDWVHVDRPDCNYNRFVDDAFCILPMGHEEAHRYYCAFCGQGHTYDAIACEDNAY